LPFPKLFPWLSEQQNILSNLDYWFARQCLCHQKIWMFQSMWINGIQNKLKRLPKRKIQLHFHVKYEHFFHITLNI
jgi:alpha/beta superfamily hydrolase